MAKVVWLGRILHQRLNAISDKKQKGKVVYTRFWPETDGISEVSTIAKMIR